MAHTKSAKKMIVVIKEQRGRNRADKSVVKTHVDKAEQLIAAKEMGPAKEALQKALVAIDKSAKKGVVHPNNAARHKSRLMKKFNAAFPPAKAQ